MATGLSRKQPGATDRPSGRLASLPGYIAGLAALGARPAILDRRLYRRRAYSYADITGKAFALQARLLTHAASGEKALIWGPAGAGWAIAFYACVLAGLIAVPLDAAFSPEYARRIQAQTGARVLLASAERMAALGEADWALALRFEDLEQLPAAPPAAPRQAREQDLLEIVYTSGATAEPKGVMITHGNVLANLRPIDQEVQKYLRWARPLLPLRFVHLIPLSHLFGQVMGLLIPPLLGSAVVYLEAQGGEAVAAAVKETRASVVVAVPRAVELFSQWARQQAGGLSTEQITAAGAGHGVVWRWWHWRRLHRKLGWKMWALVVGGAALPFEQEALWQALGYAVVQGYGLTETAPAVAITHPFKIRRGAVGRKLAGVEIRIAADGEILVRGPNVSPGYFHNAAATAAVFSDGWLHTGDLGRMDEGGNLIYLGRKKEVIVTAEGMNVYPQDVEAALDALPAISESAVVGDERGGRGRVHAVVVAPAADEAALAAAIAAANQHLEPHQRIAGYSRWPGAALPRTASTHKLQRAAIAAWLNHPDAAAPTAPAAAETWRDFLTRQLGLDPGRLRPEARLAEDLGLGSLDRVELLTWLAGHGVMLEETELTRAANVADLDRLLAHAAAGGAGPATDGGTGAPGRGGAAAARVPRGVAHAQPFRYPHWPLWPALRLLREPLRWLLVYPPLRTVARIEARGREHLRGLNRPVLFIANHQSMLDVPVILRALPLGWRPWLAPAMALDAFRAKFLPGASARARYRAARRYRLLQFFFNIFVLSTTTGIEPALRRAGELASRGYCPLIFPEGARTLEGRLHDFRPGIGVFARALGLPVVPILVEGVFQILPAGAQRAHRGRARITFGAPIHLTSQDPAAITRELQSWFEQRLGAALPDRGGGAGELHV